jgi:hypothetical protein
MQMSDVPMTKADTLAAIAYLSLVSNGKDRDPTLHDISVAVVRAAPLLEIEADPQAPDIEIEAVAKVCEKHSWAQEKRVVVFGGPKAIRRWSGENLRTMRG